MFDLLRQTLQLTLSMLLALVPFLVIPTSGFFHHLLLPEVVGTSRVVLVPQPRRPRPPLIDDSNLESALHRGVHGRQSATIQDQIRLWYHEQRGACSNDHPHPSCAAKLSPSVSKAMGSQWPANKRWPVTSPFGEREHPVVGGRHFHTGVDVGTPLGTPIAAVAAGTVFHTGDDRVNGLYLVLDHGDAFTSAYCHASRLLVQDGAPVERGETVALSGATGRVTGPHLHFGLRISRTWLDPLLVHQLQVSVAAVAQGEERGD